MSDLLKPGLLAGFAFDVVAKNHSETREEYSELALDETRTRFALLFRDGTIIIQMGNGVSVDLNAVQAMHLANAILARSQGSLEQARRAFLEGVVGDEEYSAYVEHRYTPGAEEA